MRLRWNDPAEDELRDQLSGAVRAALDGKSFSAKQLSDACLRKSGYVSYTMLSRIRNGKTCTPATALRILLGLAQMEQGIRDAAERQLKDSAGARKEIRDAHNALVERKNADLLRKGEAPMNLGDRRRRGPGRKKMTRR